MREAAEVHEFEQAAIERNRLQAVRSLLERQRVANESVGSIDAVGVATSGHRRQRPGLQVRDGVLVGPPVVLPGQRGRAERGRGARGVPPAVLQRGAEHPGQIIVGHDVIPSSASCSASGAARVEVRRAERGDKRRILDLAARNAKLALDTEKLKNERSRQQRVEALDGLQVALGLDALPLRIECFDISNLMGTHTTASMVVFEGGAPKKSDYRRFNVRTTTEGVPDDFASMEEVLGAGCRSGSASRTSRRTTPSATSRSPPLPNVIVIDGGPASCRPACARCRASASAAWRSSRWPSASRRSSSRDSAIR
jgi:excinuclease ABC subunit C